MREFVFFSLGVYVIRIQSVGEKATKSSLKINILRSSFVLVNVKRRNSKKYEDWWSLIQENLCLLMLLFNDFYIPHLYLFILQFLPFIFGKPLNPFPHNDEMPHQWFFYFIIISIWTWLICCISKRFTIFVYNCISMKNWGLTTVMRRSFTAFVPEFHRSYDSIWRQLLVRLNTNTTI